MNPNEIPDRRQFLKSIAIGGAAGVLFSVRGAFAEELVRTPPQTEGPYYPTRLPLDQDNDLLVINDGITPAVGQIVVVERTGADTLRQSCPQCDGGDMAVR